jgi:uncharacterized membrane-anchored protein
MTRRFGLTLLAAALCAAPLSAKTFEEMFPGVIDEMPDDLKPGLRKMDLKQGRVLVGGDIASLDISDAYYFLGPEDSNFVLTSLWGNPDDAGTLGMIFPAGGSPLDGDAWGIEITFDEIGHVSDEDAGGYDYGELLATMQSDLREESKWREENGYSTIELLGWAAEPRYDEAARKLFWAKRLRFGDSDGETLNYNIRALGREGVLVVNFIAGMEQLAEVEAAAPDVLAMVNFTEGNRYSDFDPSIDKVAAVGIGGLIAGKVLAKTGMLAVALIFFKKFWFLALLPLIWLKNLVKGRRSS